MTPNSQHGEPMNVERASRTMTPQAMIESGEFAMLIANAVMIASGISAIALGAIYGSVEVPGSDSTEVLTWVWAVCIGAGLNGIFFGYMMLLVAKALVFLGEQNGRAE